MEVTSSLAFKNLVSELNTCQKLNANLLIITLPGTGMGRFVRELKSYNILNFDWSEPDTLSKVEEIFKSAAPDQKFAVTLNYPHLLTTPELKNSYFLNHTYRQYFFGVRNLEDCGQMALEINPKLTQAEIKKIYELSGGFAQLIKYLVVNGIKQTEGLDNVKKPIELAIQKCDTKTLALLGVTNTKYLDTSKNYDIKIDFDLSFKEDGNLNPQKLTALEKDILEKMIGNNGMLTKSQVSDIKWGEGKYDEFSDQAVNKAMRRLDDKLTKYTIETVPKIGFILKKNG